MNDDRAWGGLEVAEVAVDGDQSPVSTAVVLLHGWGAAGDDLVALADELVVPGTRFFVPEGPLVELGGGRAWWHLDDSRPGHAHGDQAPEDHQPHLQVAASRELVLALVAEIRRRFATARVILAGFSQGAMLSLDAALAARPPVDRVAMLSGVMLMDSVPALHAQGAPRPPVLVAHGRSDQQLRFAGAEVARDILQRHGFPVTWLPFKGGHEIPAPVLEALRAFLATSSA